MKKKSHVIRMGRLELKIMEMVWRFGTATVHDVHKALEPTTPRAYSTILTMMRKLEAKGYLEHDVDDRTYVYRPTISQSDVRKSLLGDMLDRVFDGSAPLVVSGLLDQKKLSKKELDAIRKLLSEAGPASKASARKK